MATIWFTSDGHFNHDKIIEYMPNRPQQLEAMHDAMINHWVANVKPEDTIYYLGDFGFPARRSNHIHFDVLQAILPGRKILVRGNHDRERRHEGDVIAKEHPMWDEVVDYYEVKFGKSRFICSHYPFETWNKASKGTYMLHGHVHSEDYAKSRYARPHRFDVGVDNALEWGRPWNVEELRDMFQKQEFTPRDHHAEERPPKE